MYHYFRIFNSFEKAYTPCKVTNGIVDYNDCNADTYGYNPTGHAFNDAYRYVDWLLTVPLLLIEIVLVMGLDQAETVRAQVKWACWATVFSWCTYPIVYTFPMFAGTSDGKEGLSAEAIVAVQCGYTIS